MEAYSPGLHFTYIVACTALFICFSIYDNFRGGGSA